MLRFVCPALFEDLVLLLIENVTSLRLASWRHGIILNCPLKMAFAVFLGQILAQVEAMNLGIEPDVSIAKSGRDHLRVCINLLQERIDAMSIIHPENIVFTPTEMGDQDGFGLDFDLDFFLGDADYQ